LNIAHEREICFVSGTELQNHGSNGIGVSSPRTGVASGNQQNNSTCNQAHALAWTHRTFPFFTEADCCCHGSRFTSIALPPPKLATLVSAEGVIVIRFWH
jgi:hypothetical protein